MLLPGIALASTSGGVKLQKPFVELKNKQSLQRGAKYFMNNCLSCHSLAYMRYDQLAKGIGLVDDKGEVDEALVKENLIFTGAAVTDPILSAMPKEQAEQAYGIAPPDLTLVARVRGNSWLYTYFKSFYSDPARPLGTNNLLFPDVAMPNIFEPMQGTQLPVYIKQSVEMDGQPQEIEVIKKLELKKPGSMSSAEFSLMLTDLVAFLDYVAEPVKLKRHRLGVLVLLFLSLFIIVAYLLKKEYWHDLH